MGVALLFDKVQQWPNLEQGVILWISLWESFSVISDVKILVSFLIPALAHDISNCRHPQQGIQRPVHVGFGEVMNSTHVLDVQKDFHFIWSCLSPVFVILFCSSLLLGGIFFCLLRKCFEKQIWY